MSTIDTNSRDRSPGRRSPRTVDLKLEVVVLPVSDVDRAKAFYEGLGWRLDADFPIRDDFRVVQMTPPGSPASIHLRHRPHDDASPARSRTCTSPSTTSKPPATS